MSLCSSFGIVLLARGREKKRKLVKPEKITFGWRKMVTLLDRGFQCTEKVSKELFRVMDRPRKKRVSRGYFHFGVPSNCDSLVEHKCHKRPREKHAILTAHQRSFRINSIGKIRFRTFPLQNSGDRK